MNSLLHREGDDDLDERNGQQDREITLGTTLILGIFFALAILCAVFFGFGYSVGRRTAVVTAPTNAGGQSTNPFGGFKPSPGSPLASQAGATGPTTNGSFVANSTPPPVPPAAKTPTAATSAEDNEAAQETPAADAQPPTHPAPIVQAPPASAPLPAIVAGGSAVVQIAAVSHQEDAELLVTTLKRRGYNVSIHNEPQDKLLHVQVGPFASHKDADAMRQRLLADGFNAIVKDSH